MISLFPHNETAYEAAELMLAETGKAAVIHPTGTGKSFIGFKLCEVHSDSIICWLSPSSYIFETQIENLKKITDGYAPENIIFFTYAKLMLMNEEELSAIRPDYIILDEFHRCGAEMWGAGVQRLLNLYPVTPLLGLSATNIRYLDNRRDMADELFEGNIASEISLGEAIVRGILNPPKYVLSVFSYQMNLEKYQRKVRHTKNRAVRNAANKYLEALRRTLDQADGLDEVFSKHMTDRCGKYIVFCANSDHMQAMMDKVPEWFSKVDPNPRIYYVYSDDPAASQSFQDFKADEDTEHLKLLFCIDALNEGVHVDNISGIILLRPTISPIIYKQQIGRALAAGTSHVPLIFDIVNNFENLYSISAIEQEMQAALNYYRDLGESEAIVNERFRIIDEVRDCKKLFDELADTLEASWDMMYHYAEEFYKENGNLNIPRRYRTADGYSLGSWIGTQRRVKNGSIPGHLSEERIARLDQIGMIWQPQTDYNWERNFSALTAYYKDHKNIDIKANYVTSDGIHLGAWISNLRTWYASKVKIKYLTPERVSQLEKLGMIWDKLDYLFERNYGAAVNYYKKYGDLDIPYHYVCPDTKLRIGMWITNLRKKNKENPASISDEQRGRLNAIGMYWENKFVRQWNEGLKEAAAYFNKNGNLDVPKTYCSPSGFNLYGWLVNRRDEYVNGTLSAERIDALSALGMKWKKEDPWQVRYRLAKEYFQEHGTLEGMAADYAPDGIWIYKWLSEQKQIYRGNRGGKSLSAEQIRLLEEIGIVWETAADKTWRKHYGEAKKFFDEHGHLNVPSPYNGSQNLSSWIRRQRTSCTLSDEQVRLLNDIGMQWTQDDPWEEGYLHARQYFHEHGNLTVASTYECCDGYRLGPWISAQRGKFNGTNCGILTREQINRLESIGMIWSSAEEQWMKNYQLAREFHEKNGHLAVPRTYKNTISFDLNDWFRQQRDACSKGKLSDRRIQMLNDIGFDWLSPKERGWETHFSFAAAYQQVHGNLDVPVTYRDETGYTLGQWVRTQRANKEKLSAVQIQRLDAIGMKW